MIKIENVDVYGWESAIRGMRNPMNSWDKSDSGVGCLSRTGWHKITENFPLLCKNCGVSWDSHCVCHGKKQFVIGKNDLKLMKNLVYAGTDHRKFMRMIIVDFDITAPLYWWKEFDTYKVGTVANSCSTMHKIHAKEFELDDFSYEHLTPSSVECLEFTIRQLNYYRDTFVTTKDKTMWWQMIQLLPTSYNQKRTIMLNYEVLSNMYKSRKNHKLDEWRELCKWIESLPYSELITGEKNDE